MDFLNSRSYCRFLPRISLQALIYTHRQTDQTDLGIQSSAAESSKRKVQENFEKIFHSECVLLHRLLLSLCLYFSGSQIVKEKSRVFSKLYRRHCVKDNCVLKVSTITGFPFHCSSRHCFCIFLFKRPPPNNNFISLSLLLYSYVCSTLFRSLTSSVSYFNACK